MAGTQGSEGTVVWLEHADPADFAVLLRAEQESSWTTLRRLLSEPGSAEVQTAGIRELGNCVDVEELEEELRSSDAPDLQLRTVLAARHVRLAWDARGYGPGDAVPAPRVALFRDHLEQAERILIEVCAQDPELAAAWAFRQMTARGLGLGLSEARRRYQRLAVHHPHHFPAQQQYLQYLCPKWGGTWDDALGFARERSAAAPSGSPSTALIALVHLERWVAEDGALPPVRSAEVRDELRDAARRIVAPGAGAPGVFTMTVHSAFAMAFSVGGHAADAAAHFHALENRGDLSHWRYLNNPTGAYIKYRRAAFDAEKRAR